MQQKSVLCLYMLTISDIFSHQQNADYHSYQSDSYGCDARYLRLCC